MSDQAAFDLGDVLQSPGRRARARRVYKSSGIVPSGEKHRFRLWRIWAELLPRAVFIMLNPSTATAIKGTAEDDDPTISTCVQFAEAWGCGGLEVANAFGLMATYPVELYDAADPIGMGNDWHIRSVLLQLPPPPGWSGTGVWSPGAPGGPVVTAWGNHGLFRDRDREVMKILESVDVKPMALGSNKNGSPWHPLYRARSTPLMDYGPIFKKRRAA